MENFDFIFSIAILILSVMLHEVSHGQMAFLLGDPTAKHAGRLTLNPLKHLDPFGSILLPVITFFTGGFIFGWAKPVPYNPYNLKNQKWGPALVGAAGPLSNIAIAAIFGMFIRLSAFAPNFAFLGATEQISAMIVFINLLLAIFNLVPIPPLDGSKVLFAFLPYKWRNVEFFLERYGFFILLIFIFFFFNLLLPIIYFLFRITTGMAI